MKECNRQTKVTIVNFPKNPLGQFVQRFASLFSVTCCNDFVIPCSIMMGYITWAKLMSVNFSKNLLLVRLGNLLGPINLDQAIMSHDMLSENFKMLQYVGIQYLDQSNVSWPVSLSKKLPCCRNSNFPNLGHNYQSLCFMMIPPLTIFLKFCDTMEDNTQTKVTFSKQFSKKPPYGAKCAQFGPKQNYTTFLIYH